MKVAADHVGPSLRLLPHRLIAAHHLNGIEYRPQGNDADGSSEPGCSRHQKQPCHDYDGPGGSRDALTGRCQAF
jgi:hypothetical protein